MIQYFLQHWPLFVQLGKTCVAPALWDVFDALVGSFRLLTQSRQLSIRDTFAYCHTIALSYQKQKRTSCAD